MVVLVSTGLRQAQAERVESTSATRGLDTAIVPGFGPGQHAGVWAVESVRVLVDLDLDRAAGLVVGSLEGFPDARQREAVGHHGIEDHPA